MKKQIKRIAIYLGMGFLPVVAMAAYNDVSLGTSAIISINDSLGNAVSLTVAGSADTVESISVSSTDFSVTLQSGSTLTIASAGRNLITTGAPSSNYSTTCETSQSTMTLTATAALSTTVSVSPNACGAASSSSSSSGSNGPVAQSGGGGGGGSYIKPTTNTTTSDQAKNAALQATLAGLQAQVNSAGAGTGKGFTFAKSMSLGSKSSDVMNVQKVLNSDTDTQVADVGIGSKGKETTYLGPATIKAIKKFQVKYGLAKPGVAGYGLLGPKTKAKLSEVSKLKGL